VQRVNSLIDGDQSSILALKAASSGSVLSLVLLRLKAVGFADLSEISTPLSGLIGSTFFNFQ